MLQFWKWLFINYIKSEYCRRNWGFAVNWFIKDWCLILPSASSGTDYCMTSQDLFESSESSETEEEVLNFHLQAPVIQARVIEQKDNYQKAYWMKYNKKFQKCQLLHLLLSFLCILLVEGRLQTNDQAEPPAHHRSAKRHEHSWPDQDWYKAVWDQIWLNFIKWNVYDMTDTWKSLIELCHLCSNMLSVNFSMIRTFTCWKVRYK